LESDTDNIVAPTKAEVKHEDVSEATLATTETEPEPGQSPVPLKIKIPNDIRQTFIDFTIAYCMESPTNIDKFALKFFSKKADILGIDMAKQHSEVDEGFIPLPSTTNNAVHEEKDEPTKNPLAEKFQIDKTVEDWISKFTVDYMMTKPEPRSIIVFGVKYCRKRIPVQPKEMALFL